MRRYLESRIGGRSEIGISATTLMLGLADGLSTIYLPIELILSIVILLGLELRLIAIRTDNVH